MTAKVIDTGVVSDLENPRSQAILRVVAPQRAKELQKRVRRQVLRGRSVAHEPHEEVVHGALEAPDQFTRRLLTAGDRRGDNSLIVRGRERAIVEQMLWRFHRSRVGSGV